jgi:predicted amidohydrolase YtcJ
MRDGGVLLQGDQITAVGTTREIRDLTPRNANIIDAHGGAVLPGFIDAHAHPLSTGLSLQPNQSVRYPEVKSIAELVHAVGDMVQGAEPGSWVRGRGFDYAKYPEGRMPTRWDIDAVSPANPVALVHVSGHFALVNSAALALADVDDTIQDPNAGEFVRDASGRLTGMLRDTAMSAVLPTTADVHGHGPNHNSFPASVDQLLGQLDTGLNAFAAAGVTTVVDAQTMARDMPVYLRAQGEGRMPTRVVAMYLSNHLEAMEALGLVGPLGGRRLDLGPLKLYSDGSLAGCTAWFHTPYANSSEDFGYSYWNVDELSSLVSTAHDLGLQVGIHAQGDAAIGACLAAVEHALTRQPRPDHRHRIEHCGAPTAEQIDRIRALGVIPVAQPDFLHQCGDNLIDNLGADRARAIHPLRSYLDSGIPVALSSDSPVSAYQPLRIIQSAVLRESTSGVRLGAEQELTVAEAVTAYTRNAARSIFRESWCDELRAGYAADVVVLGRDIFNMPTEEIAQTDVTATLVAGQLVHAAQS